jgi:hypothetical protein
MGKFLTPDPAKAGDAIIPQSWNKYAYVNNDPINFNDPTGLDENSIGDYPCYVGVGEGRELTVCSLLLLQVGKREIRKKEKDGDSLILPLWMRTFFGAESKIARMPEPTNEKCQKDLQNLQRVASKKGLEFDWELIQGTALLTNPINGTTWNNTAPGTNGKTVADYFNDPTNAGVDALAVPGMMGGGTVFVRPSAFSGGITPQVLGLVLHELIHTLGLNESDIGTALYGEGNWNPQMGSAIFSTTLAGDCFQ